MPALLIKSMRAGAAQGAARQAPGPQGAPRAWLAGAGLGGRRSALGGPAAAARGRRQRSAGRGPLNSPGSSKGSPWHPR